MSQDSANGFVSLTSLSGFKTSNGDYETRAIDRLLDYCLILILWF
jgi:hypothetical protein